MEGTNVLDCTIVVADDHPLSAEGLTRAIQSTDGLHVVGTASNGIEAIALIKRLQPDCAVVDLSMPGANGLEVFFEAKRWSKDTRFAIITGISAASLFRQLYEANVDGLFVKNSSPESICAGIKLIAQGQRVISDEAQDILDKHHDSKKLTPRELEVLQYLARGSNNKEIANSLCISPKTVDSHRTTLLRKMEVKTTATLLVKAMRDGLIEV